MRPVLILVSLVLFSTTAWAGDCGDSIVPITILKNHIIRARSGSVVNWDGTDERCTTLVDTIEIHRGDVVWSGLDHMPPNEMHPCPKGSHKVYNSRISFDSNPPQFRCECVKDVPDTITVRISDREHLGFIDSAPAWIAGNIDLSRHPQCEPRPSLTIYYVDTVGWKQGWNDRWPSIQDFPGIGIVCDTMRYPERVKVWLPILDTVIVGTVYIDSMPDKHKQLHIRKDQ